MGRQQYEVPFDREGVLMHYAVPKDYPRRSVDQAADWRVPGEIELTLILHGTTRGRSAAYFLWKDQLVRLWPMFIADLADMLKQVVLREGEITAKFIPCKRGQNYGLRYAGPAEDDRISGLTERMLQL